MRLLIATKNLGKVAEILHGLQLPTVELIPLGELAHFDEVEETGLSFTENAQLKASGYAWQAQTYALADDSGLIIDALDGAPGIFSARYGGEDTTYQDKMNFILEQLADTPERNRSARFVCAMTIADPAGKILYTDEGICSGTIAFEPQGNGGFGYDPIFIPDGFTASFGELERGIKEQISHRARAINGIMRFLLDFTRV